MGFTCICSTCSTRLRRGSVGDQVRRPHHEQALLGQVDGRTSAAVQAWLAARSPAFRASSK